MTTLAIDRYDRHFPFFDGTVNTAPGLDLKILQVGQESPLRDGSHRHARMLQKGAFDAAETSLSSFVVARAKGLPFTAIPVFPRRLFSQGQIFINTEKKFARRQIWPARRWGCSPFRRPSRCWPRAI